MYDPYKDYCLSMYISNLCTVDSGNSKRLNSKPSLNSKRIFLVTLIVL